MKQFAAIFLLGFVPAAQAQFVTVSNLDQTTVFSGTVVEVWGDATAQMDLEASCLLNASGPKVVNMRRYELEVPSDLTFNSYCWGDCYNSDTTGEHPVWYAPSTVLLYPSTLFNGFHAYYDPHGVIGTAKFRYVWFDDNNPTDTSWADVTFHATAVGMEHLAGSNAHLSAYPVPSSTGHVDLSFELPAGTQHASLVYHNALGQQVGSESISAQQRTAVVKEGQLPAGLFFVSLEADGRAIATRRLVITGH